MSSETTQETKWKCDRCGRVGVSHVRPQRYNNCWSSVRYRREDGFDLVGDGPWGATDRKMDLCHECSKDFVDFMGNSIVGPQGAQQ